MCKQLLFSFVCLVAFGKYSRFLIYFFKNANISRSFALFALSEISVEVYMPKTRFREEHLRSQKIAVGHLKRCFIELLEWLKKAFV